MQGPSLSRNEDINSRQNDHVPRPNSFILSQTQPSYQSMRPDTLSPTSQYLRTSRPYDKPFLPSSMGLITLQSMQGVNKEPSRRRKSMNY